MLVRCERCGGNLEVARLRTPRGEVELAGEFKMATSPVEARVCTQCGFTEIYATQPQVLSRTNIAEGVVTSYEE